MNLPVYFNVQKLDAARSGASASETLLGFVFVPGLDSAGKEVVYPYLRVKDPSGKILLKESTDPNHAGCPYPPPCDTEILTNSCYDTFQSEFKQTKVNEGK